MSGFDRLSSLESQSRTNQPYSDDPTFKGLHQDLVNRLIELRRNISKLATDVNLLGTKRDTERVRERTRDVLEKSTQLCKEIGEGVKKLQTWDDLSVSCWSPFFSPSFYILYLSSSFSL